MVKLISSLFKTVRLGGYLWKTLSYFEFSYFRYLKQKLKIRNARMVMLISAEAFIQPKSLTRKDGMDDSFNILKCKSL